MNKTNYHFNLPQVLSGIMSVRSSTDTNCKSIKLNSIEMFEQIIFNLASLEKQSTGSEYSVSGQRIINLKKLINKQTEELKLQRHRLEYIQQCEPVNAQNLCQMQIICFKLSKYFNDKQFKR
ncbi:Hypothetical_protein [Hexamita inflata]|uniref:Hypothetical_protein n=1 Tax=Hexamita inflata TaxID=28002 RepID=A0AA86NUH6_9EUKA|nr:Hypothetical protein HINF_LOCUS14412 [Hexamita inflata]